MRGRSTKRVDISEAVQWADVLEEPKEVPQLLRGPSPKSLNVFTQLREPQEVSSFQNI